METLLNLFVSFVGTTIAAIVGILTYNLSIKKNKEHQKLIEEQKQDKKVYNLFNQRDKLAEKQADEIALKTKIAISEDIMPIMHKIQNQHSKLQTQHSNLQNQVNTLMQELINHTKTTGERLNKLEIAVAVYSNKNKE